MTEAISAPTILVPVDASDPAAPPQALIDLLGPHQLIVLGYYPVKDQTATSQARAQFEAEATEATDAVTNRFIEHGGDAESVVVFTHNRSETIDSVAAEYSVDAVLTAGHVGESVTRILVPLRGDDTLDRILRFVSVLLQNSDATATLLNIAADDEAAARGELLVRGACDRLAEDGIDSARLAWREERSSAPGDAISEAATDYDLVVVGESEPSLTERILGDVTDTVITNSSDPLLVVRNA